MTIYIHVYTYRYICIYIYVSKSSLRHVSIYMQIFLWKFSKVRSTVFINERFSSELTFEDLYLFDVVVRVEADSCRGRLPPYL